MRGGNEDFEQGNGSSVGGVIRELPFEGVLVISDEPAWQRTRDHLRGDHPACRIVLPEHLQVKEASLRGVDDFGYERLELGRCLYAWRQPFPAKFPRVR